MQGGGAAAPQGPQLRNAQPHVALGGLRAAARGRVPGAPRSSACRLGSHERPGERRARAAESAAESAAAEPAPASAGSAAHTSGPRTAVSVRGSDRWHASSDSARLRSIDDGLAHRVVRPRGQSIELGWLIWCVLVFVDRRPGLGDHLCAAGRSAGLRADCEHRRVSRALR